MKRFAIKILLCSSVCCASALAVATSHIKDANANDFAAGTFTNTVVTTEGRLTLARQSQTLLQAQPKVQFVNAVLADASGNVYAATGPNGLVYKIAPGKKAQLIYTSKQKQVLSLAFDGKGRVLAGTGGKAAELVRIDPTNNRSEIICGLEQANYIWAIATGPGGRIFLATGPNGRLYSLAPHAGKPELLQQLKQKNILALAVSPRGVLYVGTDTDGFVYRIDPATGKSFVVYDAPQSEISALAFDPKHSMLYAAATQASLTQARTTPAKPTAGPLSTAPKKSAARANAVYEIDPSGFVRTIFTSREMPLSLAVNGSRVLVGTGPAGKLYELQPQEHVTTTLLKLRSKQVLSLFATGDGKTVVGAANDGAVLLLSRDYAGQGEFLSKVRDAGDTARWGRARVQLDCPPGTQVLLSVRTGNVAEPQEKLWSDFSAPVVLQSHKPVILQAAPGRYLQYRLELKTEQPQAAPVVSEVDISYAGPNRRPEIKSLTIAVPPVKPAHPPQRKQANPRRRDAWLVRWQSSDPNGDKLKFKLYFRELGHEGWIPIEDDLDQTQYTWQTGNLADGYYQLKLIATDSPSNPPEQSLSASRTSRPILVDNTAPQIAQLRADIDDGVVKVFVDATDATSDIAEISYAVDTQKQWNFARPGDGIYDQPHETADFTCTDLAAGEHRIAVRVIDTSGNIAVGRLTVKVKKSK